MIDIPAVLKFANDALQLPKSREKERIEKMLQAYNVIWDLPSEYKTEAVLKVQTKIEIELNDWLREPNPNAN